MQKIVVADYIGKRIAAYWVGAFLSRQSQIIITELLNSLEKELPNILWPMPAKALHTTLFGVIVPSGNYKGEDKNSSDEEQKPVLIKELDKLLMSLPPIEINFSELLATPEAIIVKGSDSGTFQMIREQIVSMKILPPGTGIPPGIHSSIARYTKSIDLARVQDIVQNHKVSFREKVNELRLSKVVRAPMEEYKILKTYSLVR